MGCAPLSSPTPLGVSAFLAILPPCLLGIITEVWSVQDVLFTIGKVTLNRVALPASTVEEGALARGEHAPLLPCASRRVSFPRHFTSPA